MRTPRASLRTILCVLAAVFAALVAGGCIQGGAPSNLVVEVANARSEEATLSWQSGGLLGSPLLASTGTDTVSGCTTFGRGFGPGHHVVTIKLAAQSLSLIYDVPERAQLERFVLIDVEGVISEVSKEEFPAEPCAPADS